MTRPHQTRAHQGQSGPVAFALTWIGVAVVIVGDVGLLAGVVLDDVAGTFGTVMLWGMTAAAIVIAGALALRKS